MNALSSQPTGPQTPAAAGFARQPPLTALAAGAASCPPRPAPAAAASGRRSGSPPPPAGARPPPGEVGDGGGRGASVRAAAPFGLLWAAAFPAARRRYRGWLSRYGRSKGLKAEIICRSISCKTMFDGKAHRETASQQVGGGMHSPLIRSVNRPARRHSATIRQSRRTNRIC